MAKARAAPAPASPSFGELLAAYLAPLHRTESFSRDPPPECTCSMEPTIEAQQRLGPLLAGVAAGNAPTWTAVRCVGGKVQLVDGPEIPTLVKEPEAAVTVAQPVRGCPAPTPAARRASEVLRTFSTAPQWAQFQREGRMRVIGNATGRAYYAYHRNEAHRRGLRRSVVEAGTGRLICAWDRTVPAEEELLGLKLALEHREAWLLQLVT